MKVITPDINIKQTFPLAIIVSRFNRSVTRELLDGAIQRLEEYNFSKELVTVVEVPGAIEIPIVAKALAKKKHYKVLIALGAVIRGETSHYDYVCQQVSSGCQTVALESEIPVIFKVLTTENEEQAWDRLGGKHGHHGKESIDCALAMYSILQQCV